MAISLVTLTGRLFTLCFGRGARGDDVCVARWVGGGRIDRDLSRCGERRGGAAGSEQRRRTITAFDYEPKAKEWKEALAQAGSRGRTRLDLQTSSPVRRTVASHSWPT